MCTVAGGMSRAEHEQRRIYGSECGEELPRYASSPQRQSSPFPHESTNRRFYRRNRNSKGEEIFTAETGGTLSRRPRREDFPHDNNTRNGRLCLNNGKAKVNIVADIIVQNDRVLEDNESSQEDDMNDTDKDSDDDDNIIIII
ncbi:unnamed protein product [Arctia plantaginis]|uniref:Uncharacterized protein n=1 Tax=Arctia plantaginis TaxID=874455 RepID=A0A8S0ZTW8_ARCPL|nr:unnamed protein product [Arctia plantaginis]CAB3236164.1 unnamed protein product [Arctia plantaginis]